MAAPGPAFDVVVRGAAELEAAFQDVKVKLDPTIGRTLSLAGVKVRQRAQDLALANVRNIGPAWSQMKSGRKKTMVYVGEKQKRQPGGSPRPNLSGVLWRQSLLPAVKANEAETRVAV